MANSDCPLTSITAAIVCRAISANQSSLRGTKLYYVNCVPIDSTCSFLKFFVTDQKIEENIEEKCNKDSDSCSSTDWENVTAEDCDWNILISQLEDITFLDSALK